MSCALDPMQGKIMPHMISTINLYIILWVGKKFLTFSILKVIDTDFFVLIQAAAGGLIPQMTTKIFDYTICL